jgi:organic radical activating enzyme
MNPTALFILKSMAFKVMPMVYPSKLYASMLFARKAKKIVTLQSATIETVNICNQRCRYCSISQMTRPAQIMDIDLFHKILRDCQAQQIRRIHLQMQGEPTLDPFLLERAITAQRLGFSVSLATNGLNPIDPELLQYVDQIAVSADVGTEADYNKDHKLKKFGEIVAHVKAMHECKNRRAQIEIRLKPALMSGLSALRAIRFWRDKSDQVVTYFTILQTPIDRKKPRCDARFPCSYLYDPICVLSDGRVALCCLDIDGAECLGDLKVESLSTVYNGQRRKLKAEQHAKGSYTGLCAFCEWNSAMLEPW